MLVICLDSAPRMGLKQPKLSASRSGSDSGLSLSRSKLFKLDSRASFVVVVVVVVGLIVVVVGGGCVVVIVVVIVVVCCGCRCSVCSRLLCLHSFFCKLCRQG